MSLVPRRPSWSGNSSLPWSRILSQYFCLWFLKDFFIGFSLLVLVLKKFEALQNQNFLFRRQLGPSSPVNIKCQVSKFVFPRNNKVVSYIFLIPTLCYMCITFSTCTLSCPIPFQNPCPKLNVRSWMNEWCCYSTSILPWSWSLRKDNNVTLENLSLGETGSHYSNIFRWRIVGVTNPKILMFAS